MKTTFGDLAIGELFEWRDTKAIQSGPPGPEPMVKATDTRYEWSKGYGTAEAHYPVRTVRRRKKRNDADDRANHSGVRRGDG